MSEIRHVKAKDLQPGQVVMPAAGWSSSPGREVVKVNVGRATNIVTFKAIPGVPSTARYDLDHNVPVKVETSNE